MNISLAFLCAIAITLMCSCSGAYEELSPSASSSSSSNLASSPIDYRQFQSDDFLLSQIPTNNIEAERAMSKKRDVDALQLPIMTAAASAFNINNDNNKIVRDQKYEVSGVLTFHSPMMRQDKTCNEIIKNWVSTICYDEISSTNTMINVGGGARMRREATPITPSNKWFSFIDNNSPLDKQQMQLTKETQKRTSTHPYSDAMIQLKIKSLISTCCSASQKCSLTLVKQQIEDACKPGMHGDRRVFNA